MFAFHRLKLIKSHISICSLESPGDEYLVLSCSTASLYLFGNVTVFLSYKVAITFRFLFFILSSLSVYYLFSVVLVRVLNVY